MIHQFDTDTYINSLEANADTECRDKVIAELMKWAAVKVKFRARAFPQIDFRDCEQAMAEKMLTEWTRFNGKGSRVGWLKMQSAYALSSILSNRETKRRNRERSVFFVESLTGHEGMPEGGFIAETDEVEYDADIYRAELVRRVRQALAEVNISDYQREYVERRFWKGEKKGELVESMGCSNPGATWNYVKPKLRRKLEGFYYGG